MPKYPEIDDLSPEEVRLAITLGTRALKRDDRAADYEFGRLAALKARDRLTGGSTAGTLGGVVHRLLSRRWTK